MSQVDETMVDEVQEEIETVETPDTKDFGITGEQLANKMMTQDEPKSYKYQVAGASEDVMEDAKKCPWFMVRAFFDDAISKYTAAAQAAMTSKDWSSLKEISLAVTMNENNGK